MGSRKVLGVMRQVDLQAVHRAMGDAFPSWSVEQQRLGLALYRLLRDVGPIGADQLAEVQDTSPEEVVTRLGEPELRCQLLWDDADCIVGFAGLSTTPTAHTLRLGGRRLFTWCAWDSLFLPELIGTPASLESRCPESGAAIRLTVTANEVSTTDGEPVVSFVLPNADQCSSTEGAISCFCDQVHFLASQDIGNTWVTRREDSFLLSLQEAFKLGQWHNVRRFSRIALSEHANPPITEARSS